MIRPRRNLHIFRAQPFQIGQWISLTKSTNRGDHVIAGIAGVDKYGPDDWFNYRQREDMVATVFDAEGMSHLLDDIIPLWDFLDDELWVKQCEYFAGPFDYLASINSWVTDAFAKYSPHPILEYDFYDREKYQGKNVRRKMKLGLNWYDDVHWSIRSKLEGYLEELREEKPYLLREDIKSFYLNFRK